jgi:hypothetical protein
MTYPGVFGERKQKTPEIFEDKNWRQRDKKKTLEMER